MKRYTQEEKEAVLKSIIQCEIFNEQNTSTAINLFSDKYKIPRTTIYGWYVRAKKKGLDTFMAPIKKDDPEKKPLQDKNTIIISIDEYSKLKEDNNILIENNSNLLKENKEAIDILQCELKEKNNTIKQLQKEIQEKDKIIITFAMETLEREKLRRQQAILDRQPVTMD